MDITKSISGVVAISMLFTASASFVQNVVIRDDLDNSCTNCIRRGCVSIRNGQIIPPSLCARHIDPLSADFALSQAVAYSRFELADDIIFRTKWTRPMPVEDIVVHPFPFYVKGVCLTNMFARVFAFEASPTMFSTKVLPCFLVSFYSDQTFQASGYLYSLYVNDSTGWTGLSIQECSMNMLFLANEKKYPFLSPAECAKQQDFVSRLYQRKYGELYLPTFAPPKSPADNSYLLPDFEVDSGGL